MKRAIVYTVLLLGIASLALLAYQRQRTASPRRYELQGQVVSVNRQQRVVVIAHKEVHGYMGAMTMPFTLKEEWAYVRLKAGDYIQAALVVEDDRAWLEDVAFARGDATEMLRLATPTGVRVPQPGEEVPDFSLVNQDDKTI